MADEDAQPPRKKSRFFSNGTSKIESLLKGKKRRKLDDGKEANSNSDEDLSTDAAYSTQCVSAAKAVKFTTVGRDTAPSSTDHPQSTIVASASIHRHDSDMAEFRNARQQEADQKFTKIRRRDAIHGSQNIELSATESSSSFSTIASSSTINAPPVFQPNRDRGVDQLNTTNQAISTYTEPHDQANITVSRSKAIPDPTYVQFRSTPALQSSKSSTEADPLDVAQSGGLVSDSIQNSFEPFASIQDGRNNSAPRVNQVIANQIQLGRALHRPQPHGQPEQRERHPTRPRLDQIPSLYLDSERHNTYSHTQSLGIDAAKPDHDQPLSLRGQSNEKTSLCQDNRYALRTPMMTSVRNRIVPQVQSGRVSLDAGSRAPVLEQPVSSIRLDLDRDATGSLLPIHLRRFAIVEPFESSVSRQPIRRPFTTPANFYTSPKRIEHAIAVSKTGLKRKRPSPVPAPPAFIYVHSGDPDFNIFANGFLLYPELCIVLASCMPLRDLVSLYSISKDFHTIIDSRFTTTCLTQVLRKAPQSARVFPFRSYEQLCRPDPAARVPHPNPTKAALHIPRKIPSFRWVAFVLHREKVVHELMTVFAERGCPLPARCSLALKRMWLLLDIPDNARRIAIIHNHRLFTDLDLYFLMCFFVKLDMVANDPAAPAKRDGLRKLLLQQRGGLSTILQVLKRDLWQKQSDFLTAWVETTMNLESLTVAQLDDMDVHTVFGVPRDRVGRGKYEYWGLRGITVDAATGRHRPYLLRPDQLVMREAIRRNMRFTRHFFRCMLYGYVRPDTLENYEPRGYTRRIEAWADEDYGVDDSVGGLRAVAVEDGGDPLLDLGDKRRGSRWTVQKEAVGQQERDMRSAQRTFLEGLYETSEAGRQVKIKSAGLDIN